MRCTRFVRPIGGALLALAIVDPSDPATQVIAFVLGGGASLAAHAGKAGARAVVNTSPEPVSNIAVSTAEDVVTAGLLYTAYEYPYVAAGIAAILLAVVLGLLVLARRVLRKPVRLDANRSPKADDQRVRRQSIPRPPGAILSRQRLPLKMP